MYLNRANVTFYKLQCIVYYLIGRFASLAAVMFRVALSIVGQVANPRCTLSAIVIS